MYRVRFRLTMLLQVVILLLSNLSNTLAQFGDGNANEFVDSVSIKDS